MTILSDTELERYSRHILVPHFGIIGQKAFKNAHILVIGAGGLGAPLLQQLASSGVGHIGIIDHDHITLSNLPRQTLYKENDVGLLKVDVAKKHLQHINSSINIEIYSKKATKETASHIIKEYDLICDCTDNAYTRALISDLCLQYRKTLISGSVQGISGQYICFHPKKNSPCYRCLFPKIEETPVLNCSTAGEISLSGVLSPATSIIANFMALEIMKYYSAKGISKDETILTLWDGIAQKISHFKVPYLKECTAPHIL